MSFLTLAGSFSRHFSTALVCTASFTWLEEGSILEWLVRGGGGGGGKGEEGKETGGEGGGKGEFHVSCKPCSFAKIGVPWFNSLQVNF